MDYPDVAEQAINLFLEYRDDYGYTDESEAKAKAVHEFWEYQTRVDDEAEIIKADLAQRRRRLSTQSKE